MPRTIKTIAPIPQIAQYKRVAAYARVSSEKDAMLHSLSAQVSYYNQLIQEKSDWQFVGIYADEGITGTTTARDGFQRLLADCRAGKIDMVLVKSISRFARNTVTLLETVRELKALGVDVFFEEQGIHTISADGELMLSILASYAQEESRSVSDNQKWRVKRNFEAGSPWRGFMYGYRMTDGHYEIVPGEAVIVRSIFSQYLAGEGYNAIANWLNEEGIPSPTGKQWGKTVIQKMLSNYAYTGNLILQKTYRENHISKKTLVNKGALPMYHVEDSHRAIIDMTTFQAVQSEKARRVARFTKQTAPKTEYPFTGLLVCEKCGKHYRRKITATGPVWICSTFNEQGKAACASKQIPEDILTTATSEVIGCTALTAELLRRLVSQITIRCENVLEFHLSNGVQVVREWKDRSRRESWTPEKREAARQAALARRNSERIVCEKEN